MMLQVRGVVQKGVSVAVSALMVILLWPVVPGGAQACAEEGSKAPVQEELSGDTRDDAAGVVEEQPTVQGDDAIGTAGSAQRSVEADKDIFDEIENALKAKTYAYQTEAALEDGDFLPDGKKPAVEGSYTFEVVEPSSSDQIDISFANASDVYSLAIVPQEIIASPVTVRLDVFASDDKTTPFDSISFSIDSVSKKAIEEFELASLGFRLDQSEQEFYAGRAIENAVKENAGFLKADLDAAGQDILKSCSLGHYSVSPNGFDANISFSLGDALESRYAIIDKPASIRVDAIEETAMPAGFLSGGASADTWTNASGISARWNNHTLALTYNGTYGDSLDLNDAEGAYQDIEVYAKDDTGLIQKISVAYNVDRTAPEVTAFSVQPPDKIWDAFWIFKTKAHVSVSAVDAPPQESPQLAVSGLSRDGFVEYNDNVSGKTVRKGGMALSGVHDENGILAFDVDGNQNTEISSYKAHITDKAGNVADLDMSDVKEIPPEIMSLVVDASGPELSVSFDNNDARNDSYFSAGRMGVFTIADSSFDILKEYDPDQIVVSISEGEQVHVYRVKDFQYAGSSYWQVSYNFCSETDYSIEARVEDIIGRASETYSASFTIDGYAPSVSVAFDNESAQNGNYYNVARTATVSVTERNFSDTLISVQPTVQAGNGLTAMPANQSAWSTDGDTHICTVFFPGPGVYGMSISGTDLAMNNLPPVAIPDFVIDTEKPQITIQVNGDVDASNRAYRDNCALSISITDTNADPASTVVVQPIGLNSAVNPYQVSSSVSATEITLSSQSPAVQPEHDNVYRVEVNARDMAGNVETKVVDWSVNRFGSTYVLDENTQSMVSRKYVQADGTHDVCITEINPSGINEDDVLVDLANGAKNSTLARGESYSFAAQESNGWPAYEYVVPKGNFTSDGTYQITLHSTDGAGNSSMNTMDNKNVTRTAPAEVLFSVDNTAPIVTFSGVSEGEYADTSHEVGFSIEDNLQLDRAVIRVNGEKVNTLDAEALEDPDNLKITLKESESDQVITVEAYDKANNMTPQDSPAVFVNSNPFARWLHDPILVVSTIFGVVALGAIAFFATRFFRARRA